MLLASFTSAIQVSPAYADPAANAASTTGAVSTLVPDGVCSLVATAVGAGGASNGTTAALGGRGGAGASITARFNILPLQAVVGTVGVGGTTTAGGAGYTAGGDPGTVTVVHRGGGGGGSSAILVAGVPLIVAGAGGGGGAAHAAVPNGNGGGGGFSGIVAGGVAVGIDGSNGLDTSGTAGGGKGGGLTGPGLGGVHVPPPVPSINGQPGVGGVGGAGGNDSASDSAGGGGGGHFGGGGGSATVGDGAPSTTAAGGGGGASFVAATSPTPAATPPSAISGVAGVATAGGAVSGAAGTLSIDWVPCIYTLTVSKSATPSTVNAGTKTVWTVVISNTGPDPMTRGDTVSLADLLPAGPNGAVTPQYKVLSMATTGGANANMSSGAITCTGLTVGAAMPTTTVCSRPYAAPSALGAPTGGTRGLNSGESLTITYEQVISNTAPCGTISNTASTLDRSSSSGTLGADFIGVNVPRSVTSILTINCHDLQIAKTVTPTSIGVAKDLTWTIEVTNAGPGPMAGPDDTATNPLIVNDVAPTTNVSTPVAFTSVGPAGACTYTSNVITCPSGLAAGQTQTFTFKQTVNLAAPNGAVITNTASLTDSKTGDTNDSKAASATVLSLPILTVSKSQTSGPSPLTAAGQTVGYSVIVANAGSVALTGLTLSDVLSQGAGTLSLTTGPVGPVGDTNSNGVLDIGESWTYSATYTVAQPNMDNGAALSNVATADTIQTPPSNSAAVTTPITQNSTLIFDKKPNPATATPLAVNQVVEYFYDVTNTGNVSALNVNILDTHFGNGSPPVADDEAVLNDVAPLGNSTDTGGASNSVWSSLAPGDTIRFKGSYTVLQADVDLLQ
jgi:uncharacterized repeat protein (TIGR01451 family)